MAVEINPSEYKILIVDDTVTNVLLLQVILKNAKYNTISAASGQEALDKVESDTPDLILLDIMMPGMNGFEVAQILKSSETNKEIPIIFLTALNTSQDIVKGFKTGANDYISKPFNKEELLIRVNHQISLVAAKRAIDRQNEELRSTIMNRDRLYSVIAHDLRSPMGSIKMIFNMLMLNLTKESIGRDMYELLSMANKTAEETFSLLDNLLKWTKCQTGRQKTVFQTTDLVELIEDGLAVFSSMSQVKNINIRFAPPEKIEVNTDMDMVKTILRNLLSNAIKYSQDNSEITVSINQNDDSAIINVTDHGCGIKSEDQDKLLKSDTHFTTYGTKNEEGSGLGLLLCKDFAQKIGGDLWFVSEEGKSSTFSFSVRKS